MISVVIPTYKSYELLNLAVLSCRHDLIDEIVVIDDTPASDRKKILAPDFLKHKPVTFKVIKNFKNRGVTFSRNRGYFNCKNEYILFLDSDDTLIADQLDRAYSFCKREELDAAFFRTETDGVPNSKEGEEINSDYTALLQKAGSGERLLIFKKQQYVKPYIGRFRGHELAGLLRATIKGKLKLGWSDVILRKYAMGNPYSLSDRRLNKERAKLISQGHYFISFLMLKKYNIRYSLVYFVKWVYYAARASISF